MKKDDGKTSVLGGAPAKETPLPSADPQSVDQDSLKAKSLKEPSESESENSRDEKNQTGFSGGSAFSLGSAFSGFSGFSEFSEFGKGKEGFSDLYTKTEKESITEETLFSEADKTSFPIENQADWAKADTLKVEQTEKNSFPIENQSDWAKADTLKVEQTDKASFPIENTISENKQADQAEKSDSFYQSPQLDQAEKTEQADESEESAQTEEDFFENMSFSQFSNQIKKVYLPDPAPLFITDKIADERTYIEENFQTNREVLFALSDKNGKPIPQNKLKFFIFLGAFLAFFAVYSSRGGYGFFSTCGSLLVAGALIFYAVSKRKKQKLYGENKNQFHLVIPYAVEKISGTIVEEKNSASKNGENTSDFLQNQAGYCHGNGALKIYYHGSQSHEREALTEKIYSDSELEKLVNAFIKGKLVVAYYQSSWEDRAVICEPQFVS